MSRAREIVRLASEMTKVTSVREWLFRDERGKWEKTAEDLLFEKKQQIEDSHMTDDQVNEEFARYIAYLAASSMLSWTEKRDRKNGRR